MNIKTLITTSIVALTLASCKDNAAEPIIVVPPSSGSTLTLNGLIGAEAGSAAGNSVYVSLSTDTQTPVARSSWDLGFYAGSNFRVILNNTVSAGALVLTKNNLSDVGEADTLNLSLGINQSAPSAQQLNFFDNLNGDINSTVIPEIASAEADNKVILLNRGTGGGIAARPWIKLKVTRNTAGGYTLQYGTIKQTSNFTSIQIAKDAAYNFKFISLTSGTEVKVEPAKADWDFVWGYSVYKTIFGNEVVAYNFSDLVFSNTNAKVEIAEVLVTENIKYETFNTSGLTNSSLVFSKDRDVIGSNWRAITATGASGVKTDRFYVLKDPKGNIYKLKFNSFGGTDGGTRGKPVIQYERL